MQVARGSAQGSSFVLRTFFQQVFSWNFDSVKFCCYSWKDVKSLKEKYFKMIKIVFVALIVLLAQHAHAMDVKCEKVTEKSCFMQNLTAIDSLGFTISSPRDETLEVLRLYDNKKIQFLPEEVYKQFPNLFMYKAYNCSIKEVSKINFKLLPKLRLLDLSRNQIERIESNTFEDLAAVQMISLCEKNFFYNFI